MRLDYTVKKKDIVQFVTTAFLPRTVLIPLNQESGASCSPLVKPGDTVQEGQVIAEDATRVDSSKIHSSIPGVVQGIAKSALYDGRSGDAIEIKLSGRFTHTGKSAKVYDWRSWGGPSILNRINALGVVNTFSMRKARSLSADIKAAMNFSSPKIFVRLYDEDPSCQTDSTLSKRCLEKILLGVEILKEIMNPGEVVFVHDKNNSQIEMKIAGLNEDKSSLFLPMDTRNYPSGKESSIAARFKKFFKRPESEKSLIESSLFVDANTLSIFSDALIYNMPVERVYVYVSGDCLKSSAVLKVCVGESFANLAKQLGLEQKKIGKIVVNGLLRGFSVPSLDTPVSKSVKSVAFISKGDVADYSSAFCIGCGSCRSACPAKIYPDIIYNHVVKSIKTPQDFIRSSLLCIECGVCDSVCPTKLPLSEIVKILKDKQNV